MQGLKLLYRRAIKDKWYSVINLLGLIMGLSTCIIIFLFIQDELSYEKGFSDHGDIYRIESTFNSENSRHWAATMGFIIPELVSRYPEIELAGKITPTTRTNIVNYKDQYFNEDNLIFADSTFFEIFDFPFLHGDPSSALDGQHQVVLSKRTAEKYFAGSDPIGEILKIDDVSHEVTAVLGEVAYNTHLDFDLAVSIGALRRRNPQLVDGRVGSVFYSFVKVPGKENVNNLKKKLATDVYEIYQITNEQGNVGPPEGFSMSIDLMPVADIHLKGHGEKEMSANSDVRYIYIFGSIGVVILIIAGFNYMNLATAKSFKRAKEVGIRKVLGADRPEIFRRFIGESFFLTFIAILISISISILLLPAFNEFSGKHIDQNYFLNPQLLAFIGVGFLVVAILSGIYPSAILSGFKSIECMKANLQSGNDNKLMLYIRRGLVVFQFGISIFLIIGVFVIRRQMDFVENTSLGFDKEQIMVIKLPGGGKVTNLANIRKELDKESNVISTAASSTIPGKRVHIMSVRIPDLAVEDIETTNQQQDDGVRGIRIMSGSEELGQTLGLEVVEGRLLSADIASDRSAGFLLNEAAIREFGLEEDPVGRRFEYLYGLPEPKQGRIVGVIKDFHYASLHNEVEPLMMHVHDPYNTYLNIRISAGDVSSTVDKIGQIWTRFQPDVPIDYFFLDTQYDSQYRLETNMNRIVSFFAAFAVIISCLGLFGLASFMAEQRTKEVGIRKVMGASVTTIMMTLSKEFILLVVIANLIAYGPAMLVLTRWLNGFAYHIEFPREVLFAATVLSMLVALLSVSLKTYTAACANPVDSLKYE